MYPRNASSPPPIGVGQIYLSADGSLVTSGASVRVQTGTGSWATGGGTLACDSTSGTWVYTPTQAETNAASFIIAVFKSACTSATITVATTASDTAGYGGVDWGLVRQASSTVALSNTTISTSQAVASVTGAVGSVTASVGVTNLTVEASTTLKAGSHYAQTGDAYGLIGAAGAGLTALAPAATALSTVVWTSTRAGYLDSVLLAANSNRTVQVTGSQHIAADMHESQQGSIHAATFDVGAIDAAAIAADAITAAKIASDVGTEIADAVLSRGVAGVEASANDYSLATIILGVLESSVTGATWTIKRTDGSTTHLTRAVTVDATASPITAVT